MKPIHLEFLIDLVLEILRIKTGTFVEPLEFRAASEVVSYFIHVFLFLVKEPNEPSDGGAQKYFAPQPSLFNTFYGPIHAA